MHGTICGIGRSPSIHSERGVTPYTQGLLAANLHAAQRGAKLGFIPGAPPALAERPDDCSFAPRCSFAQERCLKALPPVYRPGPGRRVACVLEERRSQKIADSAQGDTIPEPA